MGVIYLKNLNGDETTATVSELTVNRNMGQLDTIAFNFIDDDLGIAGSMMIPGTMVTVPETGQMFRLQNVGRELAGLTVKYTITAPACAIDLHDKYLDQRLNATQSLDACLKFITSGTPITYVIHDKFPNYSFSDGFGGDYADALLMSTLANDFGFEWWFDNYVLHIKKKMGQADAFAFVNGLNATGISYTEDYSGIRTHIKGLGKAKEQKDDKKPTEYLAMAEYTSPNAKLWGIKTAATISDERFTNNEALLNYLKTQLQDYPLIQYTISQLAFNDHAVIRNDISVGNSGLLKDRFGVDIDVRIIGTVTHPQDPQIDDSVTFGNTLYSAMKEQIRQKSAHQKNMAIGKNINDKITNIQSSIYEGVHSI
ncbi:phage tail protein [Weissella viridescens]|uniref:phage tail protein n=1 Tax=Weissella viridescens TaxID=1629 RepID=UPI0027DC0D6B|nr:phage tail protein [uncultured Weissella sp.]